MPRPRDGEKAIEVRELGRVKPSHFGVDIEVWCSSLQGVSGAATMRDAKQQLGIQFMALRPAAPRALDDDARIDQDPV